MRARTSSNLKRRLANSFGAIGYFFCTMQWLWAIMLNIGLIEGIVSFVNPDAGNQVVAPPTAVTSDYSSPALGLIFIITVLAIFVTGYVLAKMPSAIVKTEKKVVHETAKSVAPVVLRIQHVPNTEKSHKTMTFRIIIALKIVLIIIPVMLFFTPQAAQNQMIESSIAMYVTFWLAGLSLASFTSQYLLSGWLSISKREIW